MFLIDTHAHINFNNYANDGDDVIKRALDEGVWMVIPSSEHKTSKRSIEYANRYERGVYSAVGLHPLHLENIIADEGDEGSFETRKEDFNRDNYEKLAESEKVVAIGEIGLDYYHFKINSNTHKIKEKQKETLWQQLLMARELELPVIIHCRVAHMDLIKILKDFKSEYADMFSRNETWGVIHCFSGDENLAWEYFNLGLMISFTGLITFSKQWDALIRKMPSDKFMIETDCPFMAPEPYRGRRNEPVLVGYVAQRIAEIRGTSLEKIAKISSKNACAFFDL
jgi:TatD DNase family protein